MAPDFVGDLRANFRWSIGVTTAPRRVATLGRALESLAAAGWDEARLFAEPGSELPDSSLRLAVFSARRQAGRLSQLGAGIDRIGAARADERRLSDAAR